MKRYITDMKWHSKGDRIAVGSADHKICVYAVNFAALKADIRLLSTIDLVIHHVPLHIDFSVDGTITHVNREYITNNENFAFLGNNINLARHNSSLSAAMVASSVMQSHYLDPPAPEQVLINLLPPTELHSRNTRPQIGSGLSSSINNKQHLDIDSATSVCNTWTPVSTLQELLDFLIGLPGRRREWWATDVIRRSRDSLSASPLTIAPPINNNKMKSYFSDSDCNEQHESQESYMSLGLYEDNNREMTGGHQQHVESMIEDSQSPGRLVTTMMVDSPARHASQAVGYK